MSKTLLLTLHRWTTLVFALPLAILIVTGLILSFEPMLADGEVRVTPDSILAVLEKHDPDAKARSLIVRAYAGNVSVASAQRRDALHIDLASNTRLSSAGALPELFTSARRLHETFLLDLGWLVSASTVALLVLIAIGVTMGWPRLRNTLAGWHKGTGWFGLPLLILSPLTGLFLAFGITFAPPLSAGAATGAPITLREAVQAVAASHDLGRVMWIRPRGNAMLARLNDGGEMRVYAVTREGLVAAARNWPRLIHEGNWRGSFSAAINVLISVALIALLSTGLLLWARRKFRRRSRRRLAPAGA